MITLIGTGHAFRISEQISFIIKHTWPDAVLVELDERRYADLMGEPSGGTAEPPPKLLRKIAKQQNKVREATIPTTTDDMTTAILAGRSAGAKVICIDKDAIQTANELEKEMPCLEGTRLSFSFRGGRLFGAKKMEAVQSSIDADEGKYLEEMHRRFPTFSKKMIDERNVHMAEMIRDASEKYKNIVVVVGDGHVRGICGLLDGLEIEKIRLADMLDQERMNKVRSRIWNRKAEGSE